jgi:hypothetical protein
MIDLISEKPLTLQAAAKLPQLRRNGRSPHIATIYRWVDRGCRGLKLESVVIGGSRCTTSEAIDRWIAALSAGGDTQSAPINVLKTPNQRQREHERSERALDEAGW